MYTYFGAATIQQIHMELDFSEIFYNLKFFHPYLTLREHQYWFRAISEKFLFSVMIQNDFRITSVSILKPFGIRATIRISNLWISPESEESSECVTELSLNQELISALIRDKKFFINFLTVFISSWIKMPAILAGKKEKKPSSLIYTGIVNQINVGSLQSFQFIAIFVLGPIVGVIWTVNLLKIWSEYAYFNQSLIQSLLEILNQTN